MTRRMPDPDRHLPDPGIDDDGACVDCGEPVENPRFMDCGRCHYRVDDVDEVDYNEPDEPDDDY